MGAAMTSDQPPSPGSPAQDLQQESEQQREQAAERHEAESTGTSKDAFAAEAVSPWSAPGRAIDPTIAKRISAIEGEVKALAQSIDVLKRRSDEAVVRADANAAALAEVSKKLAGQSPAVTRGDFDALAARVAAVERGDKPVDDRAGRLAIAASALNAVVERGTPFAAELATAKALAPDPTPLAPLD